MFKVPLRIVAATALFVMFSSASLAADEKKAEPSPYLAQISKVEARFKGEFMPLYKQCQKKGLALDYPTVTKTTLEQFIPLARYDVKFKHNWRAEFAIKDFNDSLDQSIAAMKAYLADPSVVPNVKRYKTGPLTIKNTHFEGERVDSSGEVDRGPLYFCGYGHFSQLRTDMPRWPGYGINIIQTSEFGPVHVYPKEGVEDLSFIKEIARAVDEAAKHNVRVDVLISPHYFPKWVIDKYPKLAKGGGGFLEYVVDEPEAKELLEKYLRAVIPLFKDKPALHSFCLTNEPFFDRTDQCENTKPMWGAYLEKLYGTLEKMNQRYGSSYAHFEDVPVPQNQNYTAPQYYDYIQFNSERFSGWHKWMADIIHEMAPNIPVHAKVMGHLMFRRDLSAYGIDVEKFGEVCKLNGNDCTYNPDGNVWAAHWLTTNLWYDLQRSLNRKPIFNSENHISIDGSTFYIAPELFRAALWQGAIHGQGSTTIWVWERTKEPDHPAYAATTGFTGNAMDRPGCAEMTGMTNLDLNRFADEVTALQDARSPVAILYSRASNAGSEGYNGSVHQIYETLNFCGVKVDFISEKQLAEGKGIKYRMIVLPKASHVSPKTFEALEGLKDAVKLVMAGECLTKDEYGKPYPAKQVESIYSSALKIAPDATHDTIWKTLRSELERMGALSRFSVVDAKTGEPIWGVEWLPAKVGRDRTVINIINLLPKSIEVKVLQDGKEIQTKDLLSLSGRENVKTLKPLMPALAEIKL